MPSSLGQKALGQKAFEESFVAIDFGTRGSRIATAKGETMLRAADLLGETEFPSALALTRQGGMLAGADARVTQTLFPAETVLALKSLLVTDPDALRERGAFFPHVFAGDGQAPLRLELGGRARTAVELVGIYLDFLRRSAEVSFERPVTAGVFTVPVEWSPFDRQALRVAARLAGFQRVRLIDEPVAVALAWAAQGFRGRLAVCSWGAGHFGASILEVQPELVRVLASVGSAEIGGDAIDLALAQDFFARARAAAEVAGLAGFENPAHIARHVLGAAAVARQGLTTKGRAELRLRLPGQAELFRHFYTAKDLDAWLAPQLTVVETLCTTLFTDAGLLRGDVDALVLAGGMIRIDAVVQKLSDVIGRAPADADPAGDAALRGALRRARFLDREVPEPLVLDALPLAFGLEGQGGSVNVLLKRAEVLPASTIELFTTYLEKQAEVAIPLFGHRGRSWEKLGRVELARIPAMKEGEPQIEVAFLLDEDGVLEVTVQETARSKPLTLEVRPERGLTASQLSAAVKEIQPPEERAFEERLREELRERGRAQLEIVRALLRQTPSALTRDERQLITAKAKELEEVIEGGDLVELRTCSRELCEAAHPVLQRVYDKSLEALLR